MKTITVPAQAQEANSLLNNARDEDILARAADGTEFLISAIDDFDLEIARTRQNAKLMAVLEERSRQPVRYTLAEARERLGLND